MTLPNVSPLPSEPDTLPEKQSQAKDNPLTDWVPPEEFDPQQSSPLKLPGQEQRRDRIVVLGRPQAGKTLYIAMLYYKLWSKPGDISMRAMHGRTHTACLSVIQSLRDGVWPSATSGSQSLDFTVTFDGRTRPLVMLDYPGEVFRRAFLLNQEGEDVQELLSHIDRAAAVILLVDPISLTKGTLLERADDNFGMLKAAERIRTAAGGETVPIALVLTKGDSRQSVINSHGGLASFVQTHLASLLSELKHVKGFVCSVCGERANGGVTVPVLKGPEAANGVCSPLRYVLQELAKAEDAKEQAELRHRRKEAEKQFEQVEKKRNVLRVALAVAVTVLVIGSIFAAIIAWAIQGAG